MSAPTEISTEQKQKLLTKIIRIDNRANRILAQNKGNKDEKKLLVSLYDLMPDIKNIINSLPNEELDEYCSKYHEQIQVASATIF
jgi:hypothetical protein